MCLHTPRGSSLSGSPPPHHRLLFGHLHFHGTDGYCVLLRVPASCLFTRAPSRVRQIAVHTWNNTCGSRGGEQQTRQQTPHHPSDLGVNTSESWLPLVKRAAGGTTPVCAYIMYKCIKSSISHSLKLKIRNKSKECTCSNGSHNRMIYLKITSNENV